MSPPTQPDDVYGAPDSPAYDYTTIYGTPTPLGTPLELDSSGPAMSHPISNDPPSYSALMASERTHSASSNQTDSHPASPTVSHSRSTSIDPPYAPVSYSIPHSPYTTHPDSQQHHPRNTPQHRLSAGSIGRRPLSDPNEIDFRQLSFTHAVPNQSQQQQATNSHQRQSSNGVARQQSMPHQVYHARQLPPRQRSVTGDYPASINDGAASVYSLDTGMNAYNPGGGAAGAAGGYGYTPQADFSNPYYSAANDFLSMPPQAQASSSANTLPMRQRSSATLNRTNTTMTTASNLSAASASSLSLTRVPTEVVGASSTRRRGMQAAVDLNKPPYTKQYVDDYRKRMKDDPDPEAQFAFAKYLIEAAKKIGDELSEKDVKLGRKYRDHLLQESLRTIKKLAESKEPYPDAQFFLANLYGTGQLGLQVDHEKAYYLYLMASKLNHPAATYRSAVCNEIGAGTKRDANRAVLFYRKAAALGDTAAMYKLSMILLNGLLGHPRNPREAIVWLRRAASQADIDNPHALHELAMLHERPNGGVLPNDPHIARDYYMQAAQIGYAPSQFRLGACHEFGHLGCPIDPRKSIAWYTRAAEKGDSEAELALSGWYLTGSEGVLKQSDTEAYLWGRKAANKGLAKAEYAVGYYTEQGIGVKADIEMAKRWYMRSAAQQNKRAMQRLTELNNSRNARGKKGARPTRGEASTECVIM